MIAGETFDSVAHPARAELGRQLDLVDQHGGDYVRAYTAHAIVGGGCPPDPPDGMHPSIAAALRDIVLDQLAARRLDRRRARDGRAAA